MQGMEASLKLIIKVIVREMRMEFSSHNFRILEMIGRLGIEWRFLRLNRSRIGVTAAVFRPLGTIPDVREE